MPRNTPYLKWTDEMRHGLVIIVNEYTVNNKNSG